jgi:AcrR family transcriptional regulator
VRALRDARGTLLFATGTSLTQCPEGVPFPCRSGVPIACRLTAMDDVARAAGVSRQGLYLYFDTKDLRFRESLQHLVSHLISAARAVAEDGNLSLRDRLVGAFEAVHCSAFHNASREDALELLQSAQSAAGALLIQLERDLMGIVAAPLAEAGAADRWEEAGVTVCSGAHPAIPPGQGGRSAGFLQTMLRHGGSA